MKRFYGLMTAAIILTAIVAMSLLTLSVSAVEMSIPDQVVFISDNATLGGDGVTPDAPLYPTEKSDVEIGETTDTNGKTTGHYYKNTAIYQAVEKLSDTGGTIVLVGPVELNADNTYGFSLSNRDFNLPTCDYNICITSTYNGVDYSQAENGGAYLRIEAPANLNLYGDTKFENINIQTAGSSRVMCANGYKLEMGVGINCTAYETVTSQTPTSNGKNYLSVAGATRYLAFTGSTDILIKSGTYSIVTGSIWGVGTSSEHTGDIKLDIQGGTFRTKITAGSPNNSNATINGDVDISITGGKDLSVGCNISLAGNGGFSGTGHTVTVTIGEFRGYTLGAELKKGYNTNTVTTGADKYVLNLSGATVYENRTSSETEEDILPKFISSAQDIGFTDYYYPAIWATAVTVNSNPTENYVVEGGVPSSKGANITVDFTDPKNLYTYSQTVDYSSKNTGFTASYGDVTDGKATAAYKYGTTQYATKEIDVYTVPEVVIDGAQIKTSGDYQGLRFVAHFDNVSDSRLTLSEYGIIAIPENLCPNKEALNFEDTYGMNIVASSSEDDLNLFTIGNTSHFVGTVTQSIKVNRFATGYHARAYIKLTEAGSKPIYVYSDIVTKNPYTIATQASVNEVETEATRTYMLEKVIEKFDSYSVENNYYSSTNLRNRVVNAMRAQMNLTWTPSETFWVYNKPSDTDISSTGGVSVDIYFEAGKTYTGIPYTNNSFSQKETFSDYIVNGVLDISKMNNVTAGVKNSSPTVEQKQTAYANYRNFPGSDCSTAVVTSWNTVLNNRSQLKTLTSTRWMIPGNNNGILPVGTYDYIGYEDTDAIVGAQKTAIRTAYTQLQKGDAVVHWRSAGGHVRLVVSNDTVNKKITTIECANWSIPECKVNGVYVSNNNTSWKELEYTYDSLISSSYIPITIEELQTGCSDGEYTYVTDLDLENDLPEGKLTGDAISNRQIISVDVSATDVSSGTVTKTSFKPSNVTKYSAVHTGYVELSNIDISKLNLTQGNTYKFSLSIRVAGLSNSAPTVRLITDYIFTAK